MLEVCQCKGDRPFRELKNGKLKCGYCKKEIKDEIKNITIRSYKYE